MGLAWGMAFQSCIFQTDPARPNAPPYIKDYFPEELLQVIEVPVDSIMFSFTAGDPDRDELTYRYVLVDNDGNIIDMLHNGADYVFHPESIDSFYHVQGRAHDHSDFVAKDWYVTAIALHNDPPVIDWYSPDQDSITTLIGSTLEFRMGVNDDHPEDLRYSYYAGSVPIEVMDVTSWAQHRFMENGFFDITGLVWDGEFGDTLSWVVRVVGEPDTIAPARITDLIGWTGNDPGTIRIQWTASGDDDMDGRVNHYRVRTHTIPILNEDDWDEASQKNGVPVPGLPGTTEEMIPGNLNPGTWLYVTARAVDDFGNMSQLGNCLRLLVRGVDADGYITDATTGVPVEGIVVSSEGIADTTSVDGYYKLVNLPLYTDLIRIRDEHEIGDQGTYYDMSIPVSNISWHFSADYAMMPYFDLVSTLAGTYNDSFYKFFRSMTYTKGLLGRPTIFRNWHHYPLTVYNPPYSWEGVDIQEKARIAMAAWNDLTGCELFIESTDAEASDAEIVYDTEYSETKHHVETVSTNDDGTPSKKLICIYPNNRLSPIHVRGRRIFAHELGHILNLGHSDDLGHLMVGGTAPITDDPSEDEINLVRSLLGMPAIFDAAIYVDE
ncbi:MAG: hypothetical protein KAU49_01900 [Candidatus Krumholzibacteria bacterium]|nr:hypothetical protein [Candidatus Krumholzibacteria bacterium]